VRITREIPAGEEMRLVETKKTDKLFKWFRLTAVPIGEIQLTAVRQWVADDGLVFASAESARDHFTRRGGALGAGLHAGSYTADAELISAGKESIVLGTRDGDRIIINLLPQKPQAKR